MIQAQVFYYTCRRNQPPSLRIWASSACSKADQAKDQYPAEVGEEAEHDRLQTGSSSGWVRPWPPGALEQEPSMQMWADSTKEEKKRKEKKVQVGSAKEKKRVKITEN